MVITAQPTSAQLRVGEPRIEYRAGPDLVFVMPAGVTLAHLGLALGRSTLRDPAPPAN